MLPDSRWCLVSAWLVLLGRTPSASPPCCVLSCLQVSSAHREPLCCVCGLDLPLCVFGGRDGGVLSVLTHSHSHSLCSSLYPSLCVFAGFFAANSVSSSSLPCASARLSGAAVCGVDGGACAVGKYFASGSCVDAPAGEKTNLEGEGGGKYKRNADEMPEALGNNLPFSLSLFVSLSLFACLSLSLCGWL